MRPGSVIVDLAAETGGNCELTVPGEIAVRENVTLVGLNTFYRVNWTAEGFQPDEIDAIRAIVEAGLATKLAGASAARAASTEAALRAAGASEAEIASAAKIPSFFNLLPSPIYQYLPILWVFSISNYI